MRIRPARRIAGHLRLPGDKSISHRAALIAALANDTSTIDNYSTGADCASTVACLQALGVRITKNENCILVNGVGRQGLKSAKQSLDCGNSGSTMRMLAGVLAGQNFPSTLIGDASLSQRPMARVIEPLELMGAVILSNENHAPLTITGSTSLKAISYVLPVPSAQVKSAILLAGLNATGVTRITESNIKSRDHTERMLQWFGASLAAESIGEAETIMLTGPCDLSGRDVNVPGDISSAAYLVAAASLLSKSELTIDDVGLNPTRTHFFSVLRSLGCDIEFAELQEVCREPRGTIRTLGKRKPVRAAARIDGSSVPALIDELALLAIVGTQLQGGIEIRDAEELRLKESDRISATVENLRTMGANVREYDDGLIVSSGLLKGGRIKSRGDHRIAMAFTIAALIAEGDSEIDDADCVNVSFPGFFEALESVVER